MTAINHADGVSYGSQAASRVYAGSVLVWERFKPTDITGCKVWLDAASLGLANGAAVPAFTNLAGSPQPTVLGTPAPVFRTNMLNTSMPCVRITQGQGRYRFTGTGVDRDWTLIYVTRNWLLRGGRVVTALGTSANILVGYHATEMDVCYVEGWMTSSAMPRTTTQWRLYSADSASTGNARFFSDGIPIGTIPVTPAKGWGGTLNISGYTNDADVATSQQADCDIAEVVLYNRKLSDAERVKVENYLRNKWAPIKPFVPADLVYSCMGWFDAADPASLTLVDGKVSVWTNKGSYGFGMGQPTATYRPTYGDSVVLLNNPTVLNIGGVPPDSYMDMIWVGKPNPSGDWRTLLRNNGGIHQVIIESTSNRIGTYNAGFFPAGSLTWPSTARGIGVVRMQDGVATSFSRDGGAMVATGTVLPSNGSYLNTFGAYAGPPPSQGWGEINEVVFMPYNSEGARQQVEGYLAHKWGLTALLPAGHLYKTLRP